MRYLLLADIHANLPALRAVLATSEARSCDRVISLGVHLNFGLCSIWGQCTTIKGALNTALAIYT